MSFSGRGFAGGKGGFVSPSGIGDAVEPQMLWFTVRSAAVPHRQISLSSFLGMDLRMIMSLYIILKIAITKHCVSYFTYLNCTD